MAHSGNGTATTYSYDRKSTRLTGIVTKDPQQVDLQNNTYGYSAAGDILQIADAASGITYSYDYDGLHRLISETNNGPTGAPETAILISTYDDPDHVHATSNINFNAVTHDFVYDRNGNMTDGFDFTNSGQIASRTISYNADNMPVTVSLSPGGTTSFTYDGESKRAKKTASGNTTYYIDEHYEVKNGVSTKFIFAGNIRLAKITGSSTHYFHKDHLGSSAVMSNESGAEIEATEYLPFGGMRVHSGTTVTDYKFTDQELDSSTNLYNYNARLYDPMIGRFISPDPKVPDFTNLKNTLLYDPQMFNRYSYCRNNPLIYSDPSGYGLVNFGKGVTNAPKYSSQIQHYTDEINKELSKPSDKRDYEKIGELNNKREEAIKAGLKNTRETTKEGIDIPSQAVTGAGSAGIAAAKGIGFFDSICRSLGLSALRDAIKGWFGDDKERDQTPPGNTQDQTPPDDEGKPDPESENEQN